MDLTTMQRACASTERFVDRVTADQYGLPTPCAEWDVRSVANHLLGTLVLGGALLGDTAPIIDFAPGEVPGIDLIGDDLASAYRANTEALLAAAAAGDALLRAHTTPLGEMPGAMLGGFTTLDILVHGWDLAKATQQEPQLEPDLADEVLAFARQALTADTRAPRIGAELEAPADASATDRLVAFLGRHP